MIEFEDLDMEDQVNMPQYRRRAREVRADKVQRQQKPLDRSTGFSVTQNVFKRESAKIRGGQNDRS